jgi:hypothetical protein
MESSGITVLVSSSEMTLKVMRKFLNIPVKISQKIQKYVLRERE